MRNAAWALVLTLVAASALAGDAMPLAEPREVVAFLDAARRGDLEAVRAALDAGMPVDATLPPEDPRQPCTERTALEAGSLYAHLDVVQLLLARGASLRPDVRHGVHPASLHTTESPALLALLVEHAGPALDRDAGFGPALVRAAANGARSEVAYLLSIGVDPDFRAPYGPWDTPAIVRAGTHLEVVDLLLAAGADPAGGSRAWSPLFPAARAGDAERARRYLAAGVDPHRAGRDGNALSLAACAWPRTARPARESLERTRAVAELLLEAGVDPNVPHAGRTPLRCAEDLGDGALAERLRAAGARSRERLWSALARGVRQAGVSLALLFGGGT